MGCGRRWSFLGLAGAIFLATASGAAAEPIPAGWRASNLTPVGYTDLAEAGPAHKMTLKRVGDRWYMIIGHFWSPAWSVLDVTDPANPLTLKVIKAAPNTRTTQVTMSGDILLTATEARPGRDSPDAVGVTGTYIWDISNILDWKQLAHIPSGAGGDHRNYYPGGKYAFISSDRPGYRSRILLIYDISDPTNPKEVSRFAMPGQKTTDPEPDGPLGFHGPAMPSPDGKMLVMGDAPAFINLDISDITRPKLMGQLKVSPPFFAGGEGLEGQTATHGALPLWDRKLLIASNEFIREECELHGPPLAAILDNSNPAKPRLVSQFPRPAPPADAPYKDFCDKPGRFGPHNTNMEIHLPDVEKPGNLIYFTWFNAGLRVFDISEPRQPRETGWFLPAAPTVRRAPTPREGLESSTQDVLVDTRGYIYITDYNLGIFVLKYTGPGQPAPTARP